MADVLVAAKRDIAQGNYQKARAELETLSPSPEQEHLLSLALFFCGEEAKGIERLEALVKQYPTWGDAFYNLGTILQKCQDPNVSAPLSRALAAFAQAYSLPKHATTPSNLFINYAVAAGQNREWLLAESLFFAFLARYGEDAATGYNNLSYLYFQRNQSALSWFAAQRAVATERVRDDNTWINQGNGCVALKKTQDSIAAFNTALAIDPQNTLARFNLGLAYLLKGRWQEGWECYEARWQALNPSPLRHDLTAPEWRGESTGHPHQVLLVYCEQGFGDTIQFLRMLPQLAGLWQGVIWLEVQPELYSLVKRCWRGPVTRLFARARQFIVGHDYQCPLLSLPLALMRAGVKIDYTAPAYLRIPATLPKKSDLVVAVAWAGSATHVRDAGRSIPLPKFLEELVAPLQGLCFLNLQVKPRPGEGALLASPSPLTPPPIDIKDFLDTARVLASVDLVVCVDTSLGHLAAAMGKPVFLLLPFAPDWRWGEDGERTHWYDSLHLFRAPRPGDWGSALKAARRAIVDFLYRHPLLPRLPPPPQLTAPPLRHFRKEKPTSQLPPSYHQAFTLLHQEQFAAAEKILLDGLPQAQQQHYAADWLHALGNTCLHLKRPAEAEAYCRQALALQPTLEVALRDLVIALKQQNRQLSALPFAQQLAHSSNQIDDWTELATLCFNTRQYAIAASYCETLLKREDVLKQSREGMSLILQNLGACLLHQNRIDAAIDVLKKALSLRPVYPLAEFNLALALLSKGRFAEGWHHYEGRLSISQADTFMLMELPRWQGQELAPGDFLVVETEQGMGDLVMLARFIPSLLRRGLSVVVLAPQNINAWFLQLKGVEPFVADGSYRVCYHRRELPSKLVAHIPFFSLPYLLRINADNIPAAEGYWNPHPVLPQVPHKRLLLVWRGNIKNANDANRSIPLHFFYQEWQSLINIAAEKGFRCYCLAFDSDAAEQKLIAELGIEDLSKQADDIAAGANLISAMDLVISVDTLPLHLAGASAIPAWGLLPHFSDFRWLQEREDSPWYKSLRLFRQRIHADWDSVFARVEAALRAL